ncbi:predicted protein [Lichtheimia corymbifera JMRC:FSU:9682]|uniref:Uncharacterized protein n=1 Tax=Lichtheimia corymbifera JMRC:FSU:9682 TaxID=1263082 RepID=A0A068RN15_9FUNG|nr:predicted protein [Lichtheimia corymbifera JMRC:FSU:9682]
MSDDGDNHQAETICGANGNTDTICSPKHDAVWKNGTWYQITWNPSYPTYAATSLLNIVLYRVENYQNIRIKEWNNVSSTKGSFPVQVDDTWFPGSSSSSSTPSDRLLYLVGPDVEDPDEEMNSRFSDYPAPVPMTVERPNTNSKETTVQGVKANDNSAPNSSNQQTGLQPWLIAVVIISCVAAVAACIAMIWAIRQLRKRKMVGDEKGSFDPGTVIVGDGGGDSQLMMASSSMPPSSIMLAAAAGGNPNPMMHTSHHSLRDSSYMLPRFAPDGSVRSTLRYGEIVRPQSCSNISTRSDAATPPITSTDALMIADTFRQRMRRPDWQQQTQQQEHEDEDEAWESKRRQLSEELLKKELAAEGTLMKKVGKRANLLSTLVDEEEEQQQHHPSSNINHNS